METVPTALKFGRWMAYLGLVCGVLYSFGGLVVDLVTIGLNWGTVLAFGALLGMPAIFGLAGLILGALVALIAHGLRSVRDSIGGGVG